MDNDLFEMIIRYTLEVFRNLQGIEIMRFYEYVKVIGQQAIRIRSSDWFYVFGPLVEEVIVIFVTSEEVLISIGVIVHMVVGVRLHLISGLINLQGFGNLGGLNVIINERSAKLTSILSVGPFVSKESEMKRTSDRRENLCLSVEKLIGIGFFFMRIEKNPMRIGFRMDS